MLFEFFKKPLGWAVGAIIVLLLLWGGYRLLTGSFKAEARLGRNTTEAAIESGKDAVGTVGARNAAESNLDKEVGNATRNIENAPDGASADAAGRDGLCSVSPDLCREQRVPRSATR